MYPLSVKVEYRRNNVANIFYTEVILVKDYKLPLHSEDSSTARSGHRPHNPWKRRTRRLAFFGADHFLNEAPANGIYGAVGDQSVP